MIIDDLLKKAKDNATTATADVSVDGTTVMKQGEYWSGIYKDGLSHGYGTYTYADKGMYKGSMFKGQKHGEGIMVYPNGHRYLGSWKNDLRDGEGTLVDERWTKIFRGAWFNDKESGPST